MMNQYNLPPAYSISSYGPPRVRMRDLSVPSLSDKEKYLSTLTRFLDHGMFIKGHEVASVEERLSAFTKKKYNLLVSCASSGLYLCLKALGIGPGDEVITTPLSWLMTSSVICQLGATPVFVDVKDDYNMSLDLVSSKLTKNTRAVLPVHYYGKLLVTRDLRDFCDEHSVFLLEDVAQAFAACNGDYFAGQSSHASVFSFGPMKNIAALGDLGLVSTDDVNFFSAVKELSECGVRNPEICLTASLKHYPDALQCAFLALSLDKLDSLLDLRFKLASSYNLLLSDISELTLPVIDQSNPRSHVFFDYAISTSRRDDLLLFLFKCQIEAKVRHPIGIHQQPFVTPSLNHNLPRAEYLASHSLCLPMHYNLEQSDIEYISECIHRFFD